MDQGGAHDHGLIKVNGDLLEVRVDCLAGEVIGGEQAVVV
jgi:hypothetical protein